MARGLIVALCTLLIASLFGASSARADGPKWCDMLHHRVSVEVRPAYNIVSHYTMREGRPLNSALSLHANYSFSFDKSTTLGKLFPTAYQGIGIAAYSYFDNTRVGTPMAIYLFQGSRIGELTPRLSVGYEWRLGFSWGWHPNEAMNSRHNVLINIALPFTWRIAPHWELTLSPNYTHFSNGDTHFSNAGSNMYGVGIGATYLFSDEEVEAQARRFISPSDTWGDRSFAKRMTYDIMIYGGWRADRFIEKGELHTIDQPLPLGGIHFQPTYHLNDYLGIGASLDLQVDSSLNLYNGVSDDEGRTIAFSRPTLCQQLEAGISVRGEISAPIFTLGVGIGINALRTGYDYSPLYTTFSLKAHITKRLFLYIGYRFNSTQYTHNLMYGVGVRL